MVGCGYGNTAQVAGGLLSLTPKAMPAIPRQGSCLRYIYPHCSFNIWLVYVRLFFGGTTVALPNDVSICFWLMHGDSAKLSLNDDILLVYFNAQCNMFYRCS